MATHKLVILFNILVLFLLTVIIESIYKNIQNDFFDVEVALTSLNSTTIKRSGDPPAVAIRTKAVIKQTKHELSIAYSSRSPPEATCRPVEVLRLPPRGYPDV